MEIHAPLYRRLKQQAAAQGCSARELILRGVKFCKVLTVRHAAVFTSP